MAVSNHERVGKALDLLKAGLKPYIERELRANQRSQRWLDEAGERSATASCRGTPKVRSTGTLMRFFR